MEQSVHIVLLILKQDILILLVLLQSLVLEQTLSKVVSIELPLEHLIVVVSHVFCRLKNLWFLLLRIVIQWGLYLSHHYRKLEFLKLHLYIIIFTNKLRPLNLIFHHLYRKILIINLHHFLLLPHNHCLKLHILLLLIL